MPNSWFFEEPTKLNSYIGGVLCSDGYVHKNEVGLEMQLADKTYVSNLARILSSEINVFERTESVGFKFASPKVVSDLNSVFNMTERKSLTLKPPNLSDENHIRAYILGQWDGDGSNYYSTNGYLTTKFGCSSLELVEWVRDQLPVRLNIESDNRINKYTTGYWYIRTSGKKALEIHDYLHDPTLPILGRKWGLPWKREQ